MYQREKVEYILYVKGEVNEYNGEIIGYIMARDENDAEWESAVFKDDLDHIELFVYECYCGNIFGSQYLAHQCPSCGERLKE